MKKFALIGAAGFIAPKHMRAIKETGNELIAALDKNDSVGIIDSFFPNADFFTEFERFDRHIDKVRRSGKNIDYISICSPNYLHDSHIRFSLRHQADAICEKPLVLNPWNIDALEEIEKETGKNIYNILQLRLHPSMVALKEKYKNMGNGKKIDIDLTYITSRGKWYQYSWKGEKPKSGGIATNIGIHFFDILYWIFGKPQNSTVHVSAFNKVSGLLELENARVKWYLSIDGADLPDNIRNNNQRTYRSMVIDGKEIEFSQGFTDLHTESYNQIINGNGFRLNEVKPCIEIAYDIRNAIPLGLKGDYHPLCKKA